MFKEKHEIKAKDDFLLEDVREEFRELQKMEIAKKDNGKEFDPHLISENFDPEFIDINDARLWEDYKKVENADQVEALLKICRAHADSKNKKSTDDFSAYLINKLINKHFEFLLNDNKS